MAEFSLKFQNISYFQAAKKNFMPGDVVWVKHMKFPFWPAQVFELNTSLFQFLLNIVKEFQNNPQVFLLRSTEVLTRSSIFTLNFCRNLSAKGK